jgi:low temperature requirement protein LtrA
VPVRQLIRQEADPLELFFDLVYVFAIGQLSHQLLATPTWLGAAQTLVLYLAVFSAWAYTTWAVTMLGPDNAGIRRMLLLVMLGGLFMNAAIPRAFSDAGWVFAITFLLIQLGRSGWLIRQDLQPTDRLHQRRALVWFAATAPLWLAGAAVAGNARLDWWAAAAVVDLLGTWSVHPLPGTRLDTRQVAFSGRHLLERCRLFTLIALGEAVLTTGLALAGAPVAAMTLLTGTVALSGTVALFWLYFGGAESVVQRHLDRTENPIQVGRSSVYALMGAVAGLIIASVGDERVIAHPLHHAGLATNLMLFGGPAIYVASHTWYMTAVLRELRGVRVAALVALVIGCFALLPAPAYAAALVAAAIVVALAIYENRSTTVARQRLEV